MIPISFPKHMRVRRSAFTLIETLISAVIVVIVLGASVSANRVIQTGVVRQQQSAQMNALADQAISSMRLLRDGTKAQGNATLASALGLADLNSRLLGDIVVNGTFLASQGSIGSCAPGQCPPPRDGGPMSMSWCAFSATMGCGTVPSPVRIFPACSPNGDCKLSQLFASAPARTDLVAVHTGPTASSTCAVSSSVVNGQVYDLSGISPSTCVDADSPKPEWAVYVRQIQVTIPGTTVACLGSLTYHADASGIDLPPTNCDKMRSLTYAVSVTISSYANPNLQVVKTDLLTQW